MSAPLERMMTINGKPFARAVCEAFSILPDESEVSAPTRDPASTSTQTTSRPSNSRTSDVTAPTTRLRRSTGLHEPETKTAAAERERLCADVHAGLLRALHGDHVAEHGQQDSGGDARRRSATLHPADDSARQLGNRDAMELALQPPRHRGRRHDRRAVALERQRGQQPYAVDLGLCLQLDVGRRRGAIDDPPQRRAPRRQQQRRSWRAP